MHGLFYNFRQNFIWQRQRNSMIELDGSEGGGQILRSALALSAITGRPFKLSNIRGGRPNPGLRPQHLTGVRAAASLCNAKVHGATIGSKELEFYPGKLRAGNFEFDVGTAGAITLVLQTILPIALHAPDECRFKIAGGTNVAWAPTIEYVQHVLFPLLTKFGLRASMRVLAHGFYPAGGGLVQLSVRPSKLSKIKLDRAGRFTEIGVWTVASDRLKRAQVCERAIRAFSDEIITDGAHIKSSIKYVQSRSDGFSMLGTLKSAQTILGQDLLGKRGIRTEQLGAECAHLLNGLRQSNVTVDKFMGDQLMIYAALAGSGHYVAPQITEHMRTNRTVIEAFLPIKIKFKEKEVFISPLP